MKKQENCPRSPDGQHRWHYPRLEESLDFQDRRIPDPYCEHCFMTQEGFWKTKQENISIKKPRTDKANNG